MESEEKCIEKRQIVLGSSAHVSRQRHGIRARLSLEDGENRLQSGPGRDRGGVAAEQRGSGQGVVEAEVLEEIAGLFVEAVPVPFFTVAVEERSNVDAVALRIPPVPILPGDQLQDQ